MLVGTAVVPTTMLAGLSAVNPGVNKAAMGHRNILPRYYMFTIKYVVSMDFNLFPIFSEINPAVDYS